jgi:hypothetical protein
MPFVRYISSDWPNCRGAKTTPKEEVLHFGQSETNMPLSYDGGLLDHLAEHMLYLSTTPSFWYSLNSSYDHGFHLSHRLGMPPLDYERLLAAANLAHYHPKWGFTILVDRWKMFLDGHHFCSSNGIGSFEVDTKRLDFDAFILGRIKQQSFRQCVEQSKWNYLLEKEDEDGEDDEDDSEGVKVLVIRIGIINDYSPRKIEMQKDSYGRLIVIPY